MVVEKTSRPVHWIKWRTKETIYGSFMTEPVSSLGFVVKICCLSAETRYPGYIQSEPKRGIPHIQLAALLNMLPDELEKALQEQKDAGRITENSDGVIKIINWDKYQSIPSWEGNDSENTTEEAEEVVEATEAEPVKRKYGEFSNVLLADEEYNKLVEKFGVDGCLERIETLSAGIESKGYKYKSHYATILAWDRKDKKDAKTTNPRQVRPHDSYTKPPKYDHMKPPGDEGSEVQLL